MRSATERDGVIWCQRKRKRIDLYDAPEWLQGIVALLCLTGPLWVPIIVTALMAALDAAVMG